MSRGNGNYQGLQRTRRCTTVHSRSLWNKNWCAERKKFVFCETVYKRSFSTTPGPPKIMRNDEKQWRGGGVGQDRSFHHTKLVPISRFGPVVSERKKEVWKHTLGSAVAFLAISSEPNHIKPVFSKVPPKSLFCPSNSIICRPPKIIVLSPQIPFLVAPKIILTPQIPFLVLILGFGGTEAVFIIMSKLQYIWHDIIIIQYFRWLKWWCDIALSWESNAAMRLCSYKHSIAAQSLSL